MGGIGQRRDTSVASYGDDVRCAGGASEGGAVAGEGGVGDAGDKALDVVHL